MDLDWRNRGVKCKQRGLFLGEDRTGHSTAAFVVVVVVVVAAASVTLLKTKPKQNDFAHQLLLLLAKRTLHAAQCGSKMVCCGKNARARLLFCVCLRARAREGEAQFQPKALWVFGSVSKCACSARCGIRGQTQPSTKGGICVATFTVSSLFLFIFFTNTKSRTERPRFTARQSTEGAVCPLLCVASAPSPRRFSRAHSTAWRQALLLPPAKLRCFHGLEARNSDVDARGRGEV